MNRTESKVQLIFDPAAVPWIGEELRRQILSLAGHRVDATGCVQFVSQTYREQARNLEDARDKLADLVRRALVRPKRRIATTPTRASKRRRLDEKRQQSDKKQGRSRVRGED